MDLFDLSLLIYLIIKLDVIKLDNISSSVIKITVSRLNKAVKIHQFLVQIQYYFNKRTPPTFCRRLQSGEITVITTNSTPLMATWPQFPSSKKTVFAAQALFEPITCPQPPHVKLSAQLISCHRSGGRILNSDWSISVTWCKDRHLIGRNGVGEAGVCLFS